ncbi:hypothetical protein niasHS_010234 [Heterodera schachtii]|uniref:Uncharacterized protein n=1 Tax=Heterodera schachtii TaxID=97005 RepID=A0ABD2J4E8_HETSC
MEIVNDSSLSPFPRSNSRMPQSPTLCSVKSPSISLSSTPAGLSSAADATSTTATEIDLLSEVKNGIVDLSGKHLAVLTDAGAKRQKGQTAADGDERPPIRQLNVSQNFLRSLDCANLPLQQCTEINVSHNELSQMRCLSPLASHLVHLRLTDNRISSLGSLNSFCFLQTLDLSHNRIEHFPVLDQLSRLRHLNLASNHLKSVPNLSRLTALVDLDLHGNAIRSLDSVRNFLPRNSLRILDIGGNLLSDLCEFHHLNNCGLFLDTLIVMGNPCTRVNNVGLQTFSYRPFIFSCVLNLKQLDGYFLNEQEILKGEWLHTDGRSRSFRPGTAAHAALCAYLEGQCPTEQGEVSLMEDEKLSMVIQKRREYNRSQSSSAITAKIGESAVKMGEEQKVVGTERTERQTPELRQQKATNGNRSGAKAMKTTKMGGNGGRTQTKKTKPKTTEVIANEKNEAKTAEEQQQKTPTIIMSKSVVQLISKTTEEAEEEKPKERSHSAMDGCDTNRTVSTLVLPPVSPTRTVILSGSSFDTVRLNFSKTETDSIGHQQHSSVCAAPPFSPSPDALPLFPPPSSSRLLPPSSTASVSSPVSSRIPVNVSSLTARSARHRQFSTLQKSDIEAIQQQQKKQSLRPVLSSSKSTAGHRHKIMQNSERKVGAMRRKSIVGEQKDEESAGSSKGSGRKKGRFSNLARKLNIRRKPSIGLHSKRLSPALAPQPTPRALQSKVNELVEQNKLLTGINEAHVLTFQELAAKIKQLEMEMSDRQALDRQLRSLLIPTPINITCKRHENGEKGNDALDIMWENAIPLMNSVDSYELFLNGKQCDSVKAKARRLRITDLNPAEDIKVAIRSVSSSMDGVKSATSEVVVVKRCTDEEGKENSASVIGRPFPIIK